MGDNLLGLPVSLATKGTSNRYINSTQLFTLLMGVNFVWGWIKTRVQHQEDNSKSDNAKRKSSRKQKQPDPDYLKVRKKKR